MRKEKTPGVIASKIRKKFNKEYNLSVGSLIELCDGPVLEFQGISTYSDMNKISIKVYKGNASTGKKIYELPREFLYEGKKYPIEIKVFERPEIGVKKEGIEKKAIEKEIL
jgi:hypothetical protein